MRVRKLGTFLVAVLVGVMAVAPEAAGRNSFLNAFNDRYGTAGTRLDECGVCHFDFNGGGARTPYGEALLATGLDFAAIEPDDSDGDGFTNLDEIMALFMPGLTCDNLGLTLNGPANLADFVDPANPGCGAAAPDIDVVPVVLEFGSVTVGVTAVRTTTITNLGDSDLTVTELVLTGSPDFALGAGAPATPFMISPGGSAEVPVEYTPSEVGDDSGMLTVGSDDPDEPSVMVSLSGAGVPPDQDGDGVPDAEDPCPSFPNTLPINGGTDCLTTPQDGDPVDPNADCNGDGIPNECQCGDINLDGSLSLQDAIFAFNCQPPTPNLPTSVCDPPQTMGIGDANDNGVYDTQDALFIFNAQPGGAFLSSFLTCLNRPEGTPFP